jgi:hypothetical protein
MTANVFMPIVVELGRTLVTIAPVRPCGRAAVRSANVRMSMSNSCERSLAPG